MKNKPITLSYQQHLWLQTRGGRAIKDVILYRGVLSIKMRDGERHKNIIFKIPEDKDINLGVFQNSPQKYRIFNPRKCNPRHLAIFTPPKAV